MEIYSRPANEFVARFVGSPAMTLLPAALADGSAQAVVRLGDGSTVETRVPRPELPKAGELRLGLRPEMVRVGSSGNGAVAATVELVERLGERTLVYARLGDGQAITAEDEGDSAVKIGDQVTLDIDGRSAHLFGPDGTGYHAVAA